LRPAPYFASRGIKWIQRQSAESMSDTDLKKYLRASYDQVLAGLSKKKQAELSAS
jgi:predicted DNA-binding protein (MmcQ/YjbR family)